jgi:hypothetical protein
MNVSDLLNLKIEDAQSQKDALGEDFAQKYPAVETPLVDPVTGVSAEKRDHKAASLARLQAHISAVRRPKVRKGDFRVLESGDVSSTNIFLMPEEPIIYTLTHLKVMSDNGTEEQSFLITSDLYVEMDDILPCIVPFTVGDETENVYPWKAKVSTKEFQLAYNADSDSELAFEINMPWNEDNRSHYYNRLEAFEQLRTGWGNVLKVNFDPYHQVKVKNGKGFWLIQPNESPKWTKTPLHKFEMTAEAFEQAILNFLRVNRRLLEDINHPIIQRVLSTEE